MGRTACTEPQCLYSRAIPLLPLWAVQPVQSLSACTRVHFTFTFTLCIGDYLKSVLRDNVLILNSCHPDALYLREQGCENPWLSSSPPKGKGCVREQQFSETLLCIITNSTEQTGASVCREFVSMQNITTDT